MTKNFFKIFLAAFITISTQGLLSNFVDIHINSVIIYYLFFLLFFLLYKKIRLKSSALLGWICLSIFLSFIVGNIIDSIFSNYTGWGAFIERVKKPYALLQMLSSYFGATSGYMVLRLFRTKYKLIGLVLPIIVMPFFYIFLYEKINSRWVQYYVYGRWNAIVSMPAPSWCAMNINGHTVSNSSLGDTTVLLYIWSFACANCPKNFPKISELNNQYGKQKNIKFLSVFIPSKYDPIENFDPYNYRKKKEYNYTVLIGNQAMNDSFNVESYPSVFVVKGDSIIRNGFLDEIDFENL